MPDDFNSDEVWDVGNITEVLQTEIAKYEELMAGETAGTAPGQVSPACMNKLAAIIAEAKDVIEQGKLNVNLMHTYIYYMERAWKAVQDSRVVNEPINFDAEGNYHLFIYTNARCSYEHRALFWFSIPTISSPHV